MPTPEIVNAPRAYLIPESQQARLVAIRSQMIQDVNDAIDAYSETLRPMSDRVIREIDAAMDLPKAARNRRIRALLRRFYSESTDDIAGVVAEQVLDAARYADRYDDVLRGIVLPKLTPPITDYEAYRLLNYSKPGAEVSLAYEAKIAKPAPTVTRGDALMHKHLRKWRRQSDVSRRLHGTVVADSKEASRAVLRAIRESESMAKSARDLQRLMRRAGTRVAAGDKLPKLVQDLQDAGRALAKASDDPVAKGLLKKAMRKIQGYQAGLKHGGVVQNAYLDLLQGIQEGKHSAAAVRSTVERWTYYKQRYRAETWVRTEKATAYRVAQTTRDTKRAWVTGYVWRMHRSTHARFVKRRPGKLKKLGGKHCICEVMNGQRITKETAAEYPSGGHPHCNCTFEPIVDRSRLFDGGPEDEDFRAAAEFLDG